MSGNWVTAWGMAHCGASLMAPKVTGKTVRTTITGNVSGSRIRIRLSNKMGTKAICATSVYVRIGEQQPIQVFYSAKPEISLEPGQYIISDPMDAQVKAGDKITVSLYYTKSAKPVSGNLTTTAEHSVKGDYSRDESFVVEQYKTFMSKLSHMEIPEVMTILTGVDVFTEENVNLIAALGDSITAMGLWVNPLMSRLYKEYPEKSALLNMGINGNRLLRDTGVKIFKQMYGLAAIKRMQWDLLGLSGLKTVILGLGVNDILMPGSAGMFSPKMKEMCTYEELIGGYRKVISECHDKGIKVFGCTITPCGGFKTLNDKTDGLRKKVNQWILESGEYDGTLDFATWIADPDNKSNMAKTYDSGDHIHPNENGGEFLASQIDLSLFF